MKSINYLKFILFAIILSWGKSWSMDDNVPNTALEVGRIPPLVLTFPSVEIRDGFLNSHPCKQFFQFFVGNHEKNSKELEIHLGGTIAKFLLNKFYLGHYCTNYSQANTPEMLSYYGYERNVFYSIPYLDQVKKDLRTYSSQNQDVKPLVITFTKEEKSNLTEEGLLAALFKKSSMGIIVGESHYHVPARDWIVKNLENLVEIYDVRDLYLELPCELQPHITRYMHPENSPTTMSKILWGYLKLVDEMLRCDGVTYLELIINAKKRGIKNIIFFDKETYHLDADPSKTPDRCILVNQFFSSVYSPCNPSVILCGSRHATTAFFEHEEMAYGLKDITGLLVIDIRWAIPQTSECPGLSFLPSGKTPEGDKNFADMQLLKRYNL